MWIQVRSMDGKKTVKVDGISKLTKIEDLRKDLIIHFDAPVDSQKLFYRGKQLVDGHTLFDYKVSRNEIIQIIVTAKSSVQKENIPIIKKVEEKSLENIKIKEYVPCVYCDGAQMRCRNCECFRCRVRTNLEPHILCTVCRKNFHFGCVDPVVRKRPESNNWQCPTCKKSEKIRDKLARFAKDFVASSTNVTSCSKPGEQTTTIVEDTLAAVDKVSPDATDVPTIIKETAVVEKVSADNTTSDSTENKENKENNNNKVTENKEASPPAGAAPAAAAEKEEEQQCRYCRDDPKMKCRRCQCCKCGDRRDQHMQILCDECNNAYHLDCLVPVLRELPTTDEWYCPQCKNDTNEIVKPGEKLKKSKSTTAAGKKTKNSGRDWGRGMACVGRTTANNMVPSNHKGPIPGVEVGMSWKFRVQVSESGCHRPPVAGIHGRESDGAYSLVLSGGYEDDLDEGDQFTYTGSGGRDLSGNKRTAAQSSDQLLTRMNMALAKSCAVPLNKEGAEAADWMKGQPIRVIRNVKGRKHSTFAPEEGNRYDGIYKIVKYWKSIGKSGFSVWKYLLRRDDDTPAPWTDEGRLRIQKLGFTIKYPEGYTDIKEVKKGDMEQDESESESDTKTKKSKNRKRKSEITRDPKDSIFEAKAKKMKFTIDEDLINAINRDSPNTKVWQTILTADFENYNSFLSEVETEFACICCQDIVLNPLIISCTHTICKDCLKRSFASSVFTCPTCRQDIGKHYKFLENKELTSILNKLFPNYHLGR